MSIIRSGTKKRIEEILRDYPKMDRYISDRKQELMYPIQEVDENVGGGKSSKVSRPQETYVVTLDQDMRLRMLERQKSAVTDCYLATDKDTRTIIDELYFKEHPTYTISGLSTQHKINVSIATAKRMRTKFLLDLSQRLGMFEP
ncbi:transcriptional regulator [Companilactobacillus sp. HBUAS56275]|uniref:transcriptional regulator n=1 Tax=Companilactobacillus sp. HBUAS56275 TaxID=3109364 RepID=UPI002FF0B905